MEELYVRLNVGPLDDATAERLFAALADTVNSVLLDAVDDLDIFSLHIVDETGAAVV
jgi:hypothetical protein